ncbi:hypothetical protein HAZT_HAZT001876, partial [Hyalella azteca]
MPHTVRSAAVNGGKLVPKLLLLEQKDLWFEVAQDILDTANTDPEFLNTMITGDESWLY